MKTKNELLQIRLNQWVDEVNHAYTLQNPSLERTNAIISFTRSFVPPDVTEDDIIHFSNNLISDEEFFQSLCRELKQCATGELVEKIEGDQKKKAIYTILPEQGMLSENSSLDIVRELVFISNDNGITWTAEG